MWAFEQNYVTNENKSHRFYFNIWYIRRWRHLQPYPTILGTSSVWSWSWTIACFYKYILELDDKSVYFYFLLQIGQLYFLPVCISLYVLCV